MVSKNPKRTWCRAAAWVVAASVVLFCLSSSAHAAEPAGVRTAFYYGSELPNALVDHYDRVVVDPDHVVSPQPFLQHRARLLAYVSLGEVGPQRTWRSDVPQDCLLGRNPAFQGNVIDVRKAAWKTFVLDRIIEPLWKRGYRGFFLDTLDSYKLYLKASQHQAARLALIDLIQEIERRHPDVTLVANRGFELLPSLASHLDGVAAESLFRGYDAQGKRYVAVSESDRRWLEGRLVEARDQHGLPVVVIDYVPKGDLKLRRDTASAIAKRGFMPWVATPSLDDLGVGAVEVIPRRVLILHDSPQPGGVSRARGLVAPALEPLGYTVEEIDVSSAFPSDAAVRTSAGVVIWVGRLSPQRAALWQSWIERQHHRGVRLVFFESFGFSPSSRLLKSFGLERTETPVSARRIVVQSPIVGFEANPPLRARDRLTYRADGTTSRTLLRMADASGHVADGVVVGPWGGIGFAPYVLADGPEFTHRWILDPSEFLRTALALPTIPAPDATTESGRRLTTVFVSAKGFTTTSSLPGNPPASKVIVDSILAREALPATIALDTAMLGATQLRAIARRMAALPQVELASPEGSMSEALGKGPALVSCSIGSPATAQDGLVPFLEEPFAQPRYRERDSMTLLLPLGLPARGVFAALAPGAGDLQHTRGFVAPFDRYRRAIDTFALDDAPRRLRPIGIRFSFFSGTQPASLKALQDVYASVRSQQILPVWVSEYAAIVRGFHEATVARRLDGGWELARLGSLHTLRWPATDVWPNLDASAGVVGVRTIPQGRYIHLSGSRVRLVWRATAPHDVHLSHANARVLAWNSSNRGARISLLGHLPVQLVVRAVGASRCELRARGRIFRGKEDSSEFHFSLPWSEIDDATLSCLP